MHVRAEAHLLLHPGRGRLDTQGQAGQASALGVIHTGGSPKHSRRGGQTKQAAGARAGPADSRTGCGVNSSLNEGPEHEGFQLLEKRGHPLPTLGSLPRSIRATGTCRLKPRPDAMLLPLPLSSPKSDLHT